MKKWISQLLSLVFCSAALWAQAPEAQAPEKHASEPQAAAAQAPEPQADRADVVKLFEVMQIRQQMEQAIQQVASQTRMMSHEAIRKRHPEITEEEMTRWDAVSELTMKSISVEDVLEDTVPVYQKHLSKADVSAIIEFYSSATGQKILHEMPAMVSESMQAAYPRMQKQMDEAFRKAEGAAVADKPKAPAAPKIQTKNNSAAPAPDKK